jgi:hypothetical protein
MKKIIIDREEGIAEIVDRMLAEPDTDITLVVPKSSAIGRSVKNFHLLKREADAAGRAVIVESVDDTILAFARESGLGHSHPLWQGVQGTGGIADILPVSFEEEEKPVHKKRGKKVEAVKLTVHAEEDEENGDDEEEETEVTTSANESDSAAAYDEEPRQRSPRKFMWGAVAVIALVVIALGVTTWSFGHATITIDFKKTPWNYDAAFVADKSASKANAANKVIPAQVFSVPKNMTKSFPASGSANVSLKSQGTLTIYNAYSSAAQDLVATTRFVTPDGKVFRIISGVTVPGAKITNGQIVPSSIDAPVVADQAGPAYNGGAVAKLTVPGFQGTPKYTGFYGALASGTTGGFIGTKAVPTAADITNAKANVTAALQAGLASDLTTSYPSNFKILDGATNVQITKLTVTTTTDSSGAFPVFGSATLQAIGFDESALRSLLLTLAQDQKANSVFSTSTIDYSNVKADFTKGTLSFSITAQGILEPAFSADDFKGSILGKGMNEARSAIAALPDLADGNISAWPMWLWNIPGDGGKVNVIAN